MPLALYMDVHVPMSYLFPRSAWEYRPERSAFIPNSSVKPATRSVEDGIPTEDRGNE